MFKHGRKFIGTLLIGFCCSQQSVAAINGHPDEDPVVKALRDAFAESVAPSAEEVVGKWYCQVYSAERNTAGSSFLEIDIFHVINNVFKVSRLLSSNYYWRLTKDGLMDASVKPARFASDIAHFRISKSTGKLFQEFATSKSIDAPASITQPLLRAKSYGKCIKQASE